MTGHVGPSPAPLRLLLLLAGLRASTATPAAAHQLRWQPQPGRLVYHHFGKSGGTFVKRILRAFLPEDRLKIVDNFVRLDPRDLRFGFNVGSIRNPCDFYVSLWAYFSDVPWWDVDPVRDENGGDLRAVHVHQHRGHRGRDGQWRKPEAPAPELLRKDSPEDVRRFRTWLKAANRLNASSSSSSSSGPGLMTARFAHNYLTTSVGSDVTGNLGSKTYVGRVDKLSQQDAATIQAGAARYDPAEMNCWIRTESLVPDLRRCLMKFEDEEKVPLPWATFDEVVFNNTDQRNPSSHAPCGTYYDAASEALVRRLDSRLFSKFNYSTCCA